MAIDTLAARIAGLGLGRDDLLFPSRETAHGMPLSRGTFNTRFWRPAVTNAGIDFPLRMHDLRHAHASWLLAGGAPQIHHGTHGTRPDHDHPEIPPHPARRRHQSPRRLPNHPGKSRRYTK
ncbi:MAG: tyrosine-type recombinase/integrase [Cellulomonas sp.]